MLGTKEPRLTGHDYRRAMSEHRHHRNHLNPNDEHSEFISDIHYVYPARTLEKWSSLRVNKKTLKYNTWV